MALRAFRLLHSARKRALARPSNLAPAAAAANTVAAAGTTSKLTLRSLINDTYEAPRPAAPVAEEALDMRHFRLPNIIFKMLRVRPAVKKTAKLVGPETSRRNTRGAPTPAGPVPREHDPCLVAFRVPLNLNKLQIRNYLEELYKVEVVSVQTMIYLGQQTNERRTPQAETGRGDDANTSASDLRHQRSPTFGCPLLHPL